jgi:hypothetical protein
MKPEMRSLLENLGNVGDLTYVGVGSAIHDLPGLNNKSDQILPLFVREMLSSGTRVTAIHFDPMFRIDVMKEYFNRYPDADLRHLGFAWHWRLKDVEVYILPYAFEHKDQYHADDSDVDFLDALIHRVLLSRGSLIFQQYTGYDPVDTFRALYASSRLRSEFKDRVLFDVSYGADTGCCTDLTRWRPIYTPHGGFMNFLLYDMDEMSSIIGYNKQTDKLIFDHFKKEFVKTVNDNHVNYRRRCKEDSCLFTAGMPYDEMADPEVIMRHLKTEIYRYVDIFKRLGMLSPEKEVELAGLMLRYKAADGVNVYDWYSAVTKIV